jgi:D-alanyl-D-alanine carboxypeptidase/D-alanyl-D-alanine-endopeptidase (penicillin-binding protein 4)
MTEAGRRGAGVWRSILAWTALSTLSALSAEAQKLGPKLDARLDAPPFRSTIWGVAVLDQNGRSLYGRNADRLFIPASSTKIVVSAVAAALLPPSWTVNTSLYAAGPIDGSTIRGDLVLYGRGDPTFSQRCYATDSTLAGACEADPFARLRVLVNGLKARGIRTVTGDLVGDGSYFEPQLVHPSWEAFDLNWWYAAPVSGLDFNDNSVNIIWGPGPVEDAPAAMRLEPNLGDVSLENRTRTVQAGGVTDIADRVFREPGTLRLWAEGTVALDKPERTDYFALPDPNWFAARALRQVLSEQGIAVLGQVRSTTDSMKYLAARSTTPLAEVASRPVKDWIFAVLNTSQNLFAEMLLKQLGRQFGRAGSWQEGLAVEQRFLIDSVKVDSTQFRLVDGSGLSSQDLVAPGALAKILQFMRHHPRFDAFSAGLPRAGSAGTLRTRFVGTPFDGRVWAKTGTTSLGSTLSGFIELAPGRWATFSIQSNHYTAKNGVMKDGIDSVVVEIGRSLSQKR